MIKVYFESDKHSEVVAVFCDEETYLLCLPALELKASLLNMVVTESIEEDINDLF